MSVAIGDLDSDGMSDLAVANYDGHTISVLLRRGDGTFEIPVNYDSGQRPTCVTIGDLNLDGHPDLAVARHTFSRISVLIGNGDGTFQAWEPYAVGAGPTSVVTGDLDDDGNPDLVTANSESHTISVLLGDGSGAFPAASDYQVDLRPISVAIDDFDLDGNPDLAVAKNMSNDVSVLLGNGDGTFDTAVNYWVGYGPYSIASDDLDDDGIPDLAVVNMDGNNVSILLGNGDGTFPAPVHYGTSGYPTALAIDDLDGDGNLDLAVTSLDVFYDGHVSIHLGNGDGTFRAPVYYGVGDDPYSVAIGDLGGDSYPDLAVTNAGDNDVSVMINIANPAKLVAGPGPAMGNEPLVRVFSVAPSGQPIYEFAAYGTPDHGVIVNSGDPDGDGADEILTGAGPGEIYGPHVRGFEVDGTPLPGLSFMAYGTHKFGVKVAAGDLDGDGYDEIVTGAGPGAVFGPHVRAFDYDGTPGVESIPGVSYFAYGTPKWGVNVSAGDIDGDGYDEIVTGAGPGAVYGPHVRGWNVDGGAAAAMPGVSFLAYGTNKFGVNVACGDVDGDGIDEIITGAGPGVVFGPHVRGWNYDGTIITSLPGYSFFAWQTPPLSFGVNVSSGVDLDNDTRDDLVVGRGPAPDAGTEVEIFTYDGVSVNEWIALEAFPGLTHGTTVAAGRF